MKPLGIYIHIPFCVRRCPYCGFYSNARGGFRGSEMSSYFGLLAKELESRHRKYPSYIVDSIYFGGGTPSLADPSLIGRLIERIRELWGVTGDPEISMEANPGTLSYDPVKTSDVSGAAGTASYEPADAVSRLREYRKAGVSRLSLGVQSFDDGVLRTLGRIHTADDARRAYEDARAAGFDNVSMDLMFGVPGQTSEVWNETVCEAASMLPEHVSFYSLQIEEGTRFYRDYKMGDMAPVTDEVDRKMYHDAIKLLGERGIRQYEISNAALPGKECRHNLKYWTFQDYLGVGASASSFLDGVRISDPGEGYQDFAEAGFPDDELTEHHVNSLFDDASDYMITGLRLSGGIDEENFRERFGKTVWEIFPDAKRELAEFSAAGLLIENSGRLYITERGFDMSNVMLQSFV